ncbi:hypothetical protein LOAG_03123 [Loa loa]|uniref:Uncharacterized protein n=1 Tax=Loa loa TaxID=7209 RepID=A0A1S0U5H4_LOALO|nr:hypothetical protein LOAG_03123 [Loa loa]EFO25363.1 hypothetical protein LOAG_03123 [Loa loa]
MTELPRLPSKPRLTVFNVDESKVNVPLGQSVHMILGAIDDDLLPAIMGECLDIFPVLGPNDIQLHQDVPDIFRSFVENLENDGKTINVERKKNLTNMLHINMLLFFALCVYLFVCQQVWNRISI